MKERGAVGGVMTRKAILIVEDDKDTRDLLKKCLDHEGYRCLCASSVEKAIDLLSDSSPDLVILDLMFRGPNGTAFIQKVRGPRKDSKKGPPIVVVSGCSEKEVVDYVLDMGASGFLKKPIRTDELLSLVEAYTA